MAGHPENEPILRLPHPYQTPYTLVKSSRASDSSSAFFQIKSQSASSKTNPSREPLHNDTLFFTEPADLKSSERPPESNNTSWGRARRSPCSTVVWDSESPPTLGQAWLLIYVLFTIRPATEGFRLSLTGTGKEMLSAQLKAVLLAIDYPIASGLTDELLVLRSTFWQGAGSPFGPRSAWIPDDTSSVTASLPKPLSAYPLTPLENTITNEPGSALTWHPRRPAKPRPGSVIYSRWIPHLKENFSMVALDFQDPEHLGLFHTWQNDPRVSQGWNETGTLEQHREYLRKAHEDPHQITILARFDDTYFAYFEVYWGKEDRLGAYYSAGDFDRGRHSLVGDVRFRGPHRVTAWWSSLMHYLFLDDPRTMHLIGEPKFTNSSVLAYDFIHGFGLDKFVDLPHKRSAFMRCSRERFFQLCPLHESGKAVGGTLVGLLPKL
ncbi:Uu.00g078480.m01.CDS01 [Anthostomella pinea]|uniref:Uu.00g078480.m01.CDS01 n=1 Tax=Anthostomella pinea TaxID=933095 RepID=A0AAI8YJ58_9PEZI|nr:Uu.00g078480.m01.CDS01 [Anthostomella pinea]